VDGVEDVGPLGGGMRDGSLICWGVAAADFFLRMPPTSVKASGHVPCALKCSTAQRAASWRAAFLEPCSEVREPKGDGSPSISRRQAKRVSTW
jgi:hypothetical protein